MIIIKKNKRKHKTTMVVSDGRKKKIDVDLKKKNRYKMKCLLEENERK
jgi:hypothetical protein